MRHPLLRRLVDVVIVLAVCPLVAPLCLLLMLLIKSDSPGAALFIQQRVGRHGARFRLVKLRTMAIHTGDRPSHEVSASYITRTGRILRRTKLDELPQLWNILRGDMTFVGPRPCLPSQHELIHEREARGLFEHLPGVTGPAQVRGIDMATPLLMAEVEADYFRQSTPLSDLRILLLTVCGAGSGDAAVKSR